MKKSSKSYFSKTNHSKYILSLSIFKSKNSTKSFAELNYNSKNSGITILELLVVLAIISVIALFSYPSLENWVKAKSLEESVEEFYQKFSQARIQAISKGTTIKVSINKTQNNHNIIITARNSPLNLCDNSGLWSNISSENIALDNNFDSSGNLLENDLCFYRDGSSNGGNLSITPKGSSNNTESAIINIIIATGFVDIEKSF